MVGWRQGELGAEREGRGGQGAQRFKWFEVIENAPNQHRKSVRNKRREGEAEWGGTGGVSGRKKGRPCALCCHSHSGQIGGISQKRCGLMEQLSERRQATSVRFPRLTVRFCVGFRFRCEVWGGGCSLSCCRVRIFAMGSSSGLQAARALVSHAHT